MRSLFEEYGQTIISIISSIVVLGILFSVLYLSVLPLSAEEIELNINDTPLKCENAVGIKKFIVKDFVVNQFDQFDYIDCVEAFNTRDENINDYVTIEEDVDTSIVGEKDVNFILRYNGEKRVGSAKIIIEGI